MLWQRSVSLPPVLPLSMPGCRGGLNPARETDFRSQWEPTLAMLMLIHSLLMKQEERRMRYPPPLKKISGDNNQGREREFHCDVSLVGISLLTTLYFCDKVLLDTFLIGAAHALIYQVPHL